MAEGRRRKIQQAVKIKLHRCGAEQIAATYYLIYAHERIVDDNSQLVGVHSVAAAQDKVTAFVRQVGLLPAVVHIRKGDKLVGNFDAPGGTALLHFGAALCCRQLAAGAGINNTSVAGVRCFGGVQLAAAAKAGIDKPLLL